MTDDYLYHRNASVLNGLGHVLVGLTNSNKEQLLSAGYRTFRGCSAEAQSICTRLAQLNPEIAHLFKPREETLSRLSLRMVLAKPCNIPFKVAPVQSFIAVSYAWHYPDWLLPAAGTPIAPGWDISKAMADAVMACREDDREGVWIDKLCINQDDEQDKTRHVGAMDIIYRSARRLIILLEDVQLDDDETFAALLYQRWFQDMCNAVTEKDIGRDEKNDFLLSFMFRKDGEYIQGRHLSAEQNSSDTLSSSISFARLVAGRRSLTIKISRARWFSRAWCAHESRIKPHEMLYNPRMLCFGPDGTVLSFEYRFIYWLSTYIKDASDAADQLVSAATKGNPVSSWGNYKVGPNALQAAIYSGNEPMRDHEGFVRLMKVIIDPDVSESRQSRYRMLWMQAERRGNCCALRHLQDILSHECRYMGDMISIALNTSNIPLVFTGKVDTAQEAIRIFSVLVLALDDVAPLLASLAWHRLSDHVTSWSPLATSSTLPDALRLPDPSVIYSITREYIELDLLVFRTIPMEPSSSALTKASTLIRKFNLESFARTYVGSSNSDIQLLSAVRGLSIDMIKRGTLKPMDVFVKTWLAHGIDCVFAWMARFPDTMQQATKGGFLYGTIENVPDDRLNPAARALLAMTSGPENTEPNNGNRVQGLARFLRTVFDPRLKFFHAQPRRLALGPADHAIVRQTTNVGYIAVPLALAHTPAQYQRAWVLEPFDPVAEQHCPERVQDYLPDPARTEIKPGEEVEDVYPLLTSDFDDRRKPINDLGTWKLRSRSEIIGCQSFEPIISRLTAKSIEDDENMTLLRKQRVYGAKDHDWAAVFEATKRLGGINASEKDEDQNARAWTGFFRRLFQIDAWA